MSHLLLAATYAPFDSKNLNGGDTAWVLASAALVLLMTPALAFFYGGMVRAKHVLAMLMQNFAAIAIVSVTWIVIGFTWAFGGDGKYLGDLHFFGMQNINDVVPTLGSAQTTPTMVFVAFQLTFAIITPALITGSTADRWKFGAFAAFVTIWSVVVYAPVAHWVFDGYGWLNRSLLPSEHGHFFAEDFAGGTVVHINAGAAGLAMALVLGKRRGWPKTNMRGHNIPFVMLGAGLLWFGWFGFNAGSALTASNLAGFAWVNTNTATATALLGWIIVEKIKYGKCTALGAASGAVAGLVAITPCAGWVSPIGSIFIGLIAGAICALAIGIKNKLGFDDSLDVVGVHFVGGWVGTLCIGFFSTTGANSLGNNGILYGGGGHYGGWNLLGHQAFAAGVVSVFSFVATVVIALVVNLFIKNRVTEEEELEGLDTSIHGESAYEFGPLGGTLGGTGGLGALTGSPKERVDA
ncbi:MAG TPA: ammonium transporter [Jatrophihabitans sp.]|uniref:ammonium transporter n=1 Tax=Jatrophihabitans sp. TaxID=1932789 RepID=UPI002DF88490|nr:ammonium transporter [Jatrophihabitans sp.]